MLPFTEVYLPCRKGNSSALGQQGLLFGMPMGVERVCPMVSARLEASKLTEVRIYKRADQPSRDVSLTSNSQIPSSLRAFPR